MKEAGLGAGEAAAGELAAGSATRSSGGLGQASTGDLLGEAARAPGITEGSRGPVVHVFFDFNCAFCSMLYAQMRPLLRDRRLRVHWIPVAVLAESSRAQAAAVLEARSPAAAMAEHQARRSAGRADAADRPPQRATLEALEANNDLLRRVNGGLAATPVLLFQGRDGRTVRTPGALQPSSDLLAVLPPAD
jgi:thiol:disulfide interchange protein DsbG